MPALTFTATDDLVTLTAPPAAAGLFARLIGNVSPASVDAMSREDWALGLALSDLRALAEDEPSGALAIGEAEITLSHGLAASLDGETARMLGLPAFTDLTFETGVSGLLGSPGFRLDRRWTRGGRAASPARTGAILHTDRGERRVPRAAYDAILIAEAFDDAAPLAEHWSALARFRRTLRPDDEEEDGPPDERARIAMTGFLGSLRIASANAFAMALRDDGQGGVTFDPLPFSTGEGEQTAALAEGALGEFHDDFERRGASTAYRTGDNSYLVVERGAAPALAVMARKQQAPRAEREAFVANPAPDLTDAYEAALESEGAFDGADDTAREALVEAAVGQTFVQTEEYLSARVVGVGAWRPPEIGGAATHKTTWLPEAFTETQRAALQSKSSAQLEVIRENHAKALDQGDSHIDVGGGVTIPVGPRTEAELETRAEEAREEEEDRAGDKPPAPESPPTQENQATPAEAIVLQTKLNFDALTFSPARIPRSAPVPDTMPAAVTSTPMPHQQVSFDWQVAAWRAGVPGLLNADEPGLGKTLQTLAFLSWLRGAMAAGPVEGRLPILIVAPTSLLMNWEKEVATHLDADGLGTVLRLYGSGVTARKVHGAEGRETDDGTARLDFRDLHEAIEDGRGQDRWLLTTYQTLMNYQHSFGRLRFAVAVFDEIQAIKNPATLGAAAVRSLDARFRIGLTGTPIENRLTDIWAILDQLAPGELASLRDFRKAFEPPTEEGMAALNARIFGTGAPGETPLGIRRLKTDVAAHLPPKLRLLHPRVMPPIQATRYEEAHEKAASSPKGGALKALQHIRSVSAHPGAVEGEGDAAFVAASARLAATVELLHWIRARGERALVFIEHTRLQYRFAEILRRLFALDEVLIINGNTPPPKRQPIVDKFQRHGTDGTEFDVLILAPRAAGTGLTLTAACHVIHLSRWWNPAVEEQCNDRTHRIGQTKPVTVHMPMAIHPDYVTASFDCLLHDLMRGKRNLAEAALWPAGDVPEDIGALLDGLASSMSQGRPGVPDAAALSDDARGAGFAVDALPGGGLALRGKAGSPPLELRTKSATGWTLGPDAAARIVLGGTAPAPGAAAPPLTALDGEMMALWPRYALDG